MVHNDMYIDRFVVCVSVNGTLQQDPNGRVAIPYGTEYGLYLKNKNDRRALAHVFIDGECVSGTGYVLNPRQSFTLERFNEVNKKFKFVAQDSQAAKAEGKEHNSKPGLIEIRWHLEKEKYQPPVYKPTIPKPSRIRPWNDDPYYWHTPNYTLRGMSIGSSLGSSQSYACNFVSQETCFGELKEEKTSGNLCLTGVTAEGSHSNQTFGSTSFDEEPEYTSMFLQLVPLVSKQFEYKSPDGNLYYKSTVTGSPEDILEEENRLLKLQLENEKLKKELSKIK